MRRIILFLTFLLSIFLLGLFGSELLHWDTSPPRSKSRQNFDSENFSVATFAGGCFWCMEEPFEKMAGIKAVTSGFSGGEENSPSYKEVAMGKTSHREAVQIHYDPSEVSYLELLKIFWKQINPVDGEGQFADRGHHYTTAIFYHGERQKALAERSLEALKEAKIFNGSIQTEILPYRNFYPADEGHQDYYRKNPTHYYAYKKGSGRASFIHSLWDAREFPHIQPLELKYLKPDDKILREKLSAIQYKVTRENGTELPFQNEYFKFKKEGIYVDIVSGEPLFASLHKFDSGTGWPSFYQPLEPTNIIEKMDHSYGMQRVEVRSKFADSHLGHLFQDGPHPTGLRYCINSAALRFIPRKMLEEEGFGAYSKLFQNP